MDVSSISLSQAYKTSFLKHLFLLSEKLEWNTVVEFIFQPQWSTHSTPQTCQHCQLRPYFQQLKQKGPQIYCHLHPSLQLLLLLSHPCYGLAYTTPFATGPARAFHSTKVRTRSTLGNIFHLHSPYIMKCKKAIWQTVSFSSTRIPKLSPCEQPF